MITRIKESSSWAIRLVVDQGCHFHQNYPMAGASASLPAPTFDKYGKSLEDGIKPDVYVNMDKILEEGIEQGDIESQKKDPLIEKAFEILSE